MVPPMTMQAEKDAAVRFKLQAPPSPTSTCSTGLPLSPRDSEVDCTDSEHWCNTQSVGLSRDQDGIATFEVTSFVPEQLISSIIETVFEWTVFAAAGLSSTRCHRSGIAGGTVVPDLPTLLRTANSADADGCTATSKTGHFRRTPEHFVWQVCNGVRKPKPAAGPLASAMRATVLVAFCPIVMGIVAIGICILAVGSVASLALCLRSLFSAAEPRPVKKGSAVEPSAKHAVAAAAAGGSSARTACLCTEAKLFRGSSSM
mmetsp:Transcript_8277/g.21187  ORF Transcript_8277/g.21187 Transcript_8277/m.21187 type:complete len:259 (-) Transcript_8277:256-1032(-)